MSVSCSECNIRYAAELPACPWCGHIKEAAPVSATKQEPQAPAGDGAAPSHTATRPVPPPPPPPPSGADAYNLAEIPGPDEEWEPIDEWLADDPDAYVEPEAQSWRERVRRWALIGAGAGALIVFGAFLAEVIPVGVGGSDESAATLATSAAVTEPPVATTLPPPPTTLVPATTTAPPTTTTTPVIEPLGSPLPAGDLRIFDTGFGELTFGSDGLNAVGRLTSTFGQPDVDTGVQPAPPGGEGGFCEGAQQRVVRWGSLSAFNRVNDDGSQTFTSVQLDLINATDPDPAAEAASLSGLRIGDTTADLRSIYDGFRIDEPGGGVWELRAGSDGRLLLWGTASDAGEITSIRSSLQCTG